MAGAGWLAGWLQLEEGEMQFLALSGGMMLPLERDICGGGERGAWES